MKNRRLFILLTVLLTALPLGMIYAWSIMQPYVMDTFGYNSQRATLPYTLYFALYPVGQFISGLLQKKLKERSVILIAFLLMVGALLSSSYLAYKRFPGIEYTFGVLYAVGNAISNNVYVVITIRWWPDKKGVAIGLLLAVYSLSSMVFASVFGALLPMLGLIPVFILMSSLHVLVGLAAVSIIRNPPAGFMSEYHDPNRPPVPTAQQCSTVRECMHSRIFWMFFFLNFCKIPAYTLVNSNFVCNADAHQVSTALAVTGVSIASMMQLGGRLVLSGLSDRLGGRVLIITANICMTAGILLCPVSTGYVYLLVLWMLSFGYGGYTSLNSATLTDYLGTQSSGLIISLCSFGYGISSLVTTYLFKRFSFSGALTAATVVALIGLTLAILLPQIEERSSTESMILAGVGRH